MSKKRAVLSALFILGALLSLALLLGFSSLGIQSAQADEGEFAASSIGSSSSLPKANIEKLADEYDNAVSSSLLTNARAAAMQRNIAVLEARIPDLQKKSDDSLRELYKLQGRKYEIIEMLLSSETLVDFIKQAEYVENISRSNASNVTALKTAQSQLDAAYASVEAAKAQADARIESASDALNEETASRVKKREEGVEKAQSQASSLGGSASVGKDGSGNDQPESFRIAASSDIKVLDDGANWAVTEEEFIAEWAPRIDAYFIGSPLAGQGKNFARSAWRYCIDPRWSAAISNTESSKGRYCIRPHNAWGWGAADSNPYGLASQWASWEEAIDAHAAGLARGYGYTITINGAKKYCPYTWQSWYNNTLSEMAKI